MNKNFIKSISLISVLMTVFFVFSFLSNVNTTSAQCYDDFGYVYNCGGGVNTSCPAGTTLGADGWTCVSNTYTSCPAGTTLGADGWTCVSNVNTSCPAGTTLGADGWTCVSINNPIYPTTFRCSDGSIVNYQWQCPVYYNQPSYNYPIYQPIYTPAPIVQQTHICWNGLSYPLSQSCPAQYQTCQDGSVILVTQTCPVTTHICWDGLSYPISQACPVRTQTCPNGQVIPITSTCPAQTQVCWNGAIVPVNQACPAQYQTCWDGSVILLSQTCPTKTTTTITIKKVEVINHSVVTDLATKVGQTSAQCNGVGLISNGISSVGWFEYGETTDVNKTTNSASIGSSSNAPFSNVLTGLKPNTTYYCRAVMANKDGTYRGKIVSFKTLKNKVTYAAPKAKAKTAPKTKTEFVCADGSIAVAKTVLVGETINAGGKLLAINIERSIPDLTQGSVFNYRITITNNSDTAVTGVEAKIVLPSELSFIDATTTGGVVIKDNIMTVPVENINSKEVKTFILPVKIDNKAELGKTIVTTVYASYNLPVTGSTVVKDEVSAYMMGNIVASDGKSTDTEKSKSLASILFPQTLLGWLILFAIILIIVVLIMNIRKWLADRKREKEEHTIHHHIA